jgi:hypothetical protein
MHGLIFETSVWLLAESTRLLSSHIQNRIECKRFASRSHHHYHYPFTVIMTTIVKSSQVNRTRQILKEHKRERKLTLRQMEKYALLSLRPRCNSSHYRKPETMAKYNRNRTENPFTATKSRQEWTCSSQFERTLEVTAHKTTPFIVLLIVRRTRHEKTKSRHAYEQLTSVHAQQDRSIFLNLRNV